TADLLLEISFRGSYLAQRMIAKATKAYCVSLLDPTSGQSEELFLEAEALLQRVTPNEVLHSVSGYRYREYLMIKGDWTGAQLQSQVSQQRSEDLGLLSKALDQVSLGRAMLGIALQTVGRPGGSSLSPERGKISRCLTDALDQL